PGPAAAAAGPARIAHVPCRPPAAGRKGPSAVRRPRSGGGGNRLRATARVRQGALASREGGGGKAPCPPSSTTSGARWKARPDRPLGFHRDQCPGRCRPARLILARPVPVGRLRLRPLGFGGLAPPPAPRPNSAAARRRAVAHRPCGACRRATPP